MAGAVKTDGRAARWAGHRERRRAEIVDAAIGVIERVGPQARVAEITSELGIGRPSLYRQFTDRADLDQAIADRAVDLLVAELLPHLRYTGGPGSEPDPTRVRTVISGAIGAYVDFVQATPNIYRFVRTQIADSDPVGRAKSQVAQSVAALARDFLRDSGLPTEELAAYALPFSTGIVGLTDAVVSAWLDEPAELDRDGLVLLLTNLVEGAVAGVLGPGLSL